MKNIVFIGAGRITESIIKNLLEYSSDIFSEELNFSFIGHKSENPNRIEPLPIKGLIETYKISLIAKGISINENIIINDESFFIEDTNCLKTADFIVFTAALFPSMEELSKARELGTGREAQQKLNLPIIEYYANEIKNKTSVNTPILITTNPVDVLAEYLRKLTNDQFKVLGLGGGVDSARFKYILSKEMQIPISKIDGFVGFMHNKLMQPIINTVKVEGKNINEYNIPEDKWNTIIEKVKNFGNFVSKQSQKHLNINAGDANTPGVVIAKTLSCYFGKKKENTVYNFKDLNDKTGFQRPITIAKNSIESYDVNYTNEEKELICKIQSIITKELEKLI